MLKHSRLMLAVFAAAALLALPAVGQAAHNGKTHGQGKSCAKPTVKAGFVVKGTLTSFTADDPATTADEESVTITVTRANRHARRSGELTDRDPAKPGVQVAGGTFSVNGSTDAFKVGLSGYDTGETPSTGDKVRIVGKVALTKKRCAAADATFDERYGAVNVRRVKVIDAN